MKLGRALRRVLLGWAAWRLLGPELQPRYRVPQVHPARVPGRTVFVGEREFFVREAGPADAPRLLLVHGWAYDGLATWHRTLETLAEHHRVVIVDQRNHGRSDDIRGRFTIEQAADELAGLIGAVGLGRVAVVGYSMGGMVAMALARRHPGSVDRVVLGATATRPIPERRRLARMALGAARAFGRVSIVEWARVMHRYLLAQGAIEERHSRWLWETLMDRDTTLSFESAFAIWHFDARPWIGAIDVPVRVIVPSKDQLVPPSEQRRLADQLPQADILELEGARHEAVWTHHDEMAKAILEFLADSPQLTADS